MNAPSPLKAWRTACERLAALGERIVASPFPATDAGVLEGFEHLVDQTVVWMAWETLHADPTRPFFHRQNDLVSQWGGPNADNIYMHARIEPGRRYRVRGRMHSCEEFILAVRAGFMHRPVWGTLVQVVASERGIETGDHFDLLFGGDDPDAIALPEGAAMISVRQYYYDWKAEEPATFTIECLDPGPPAALDAEAFATRLDESLNEIEESINYWNTYLNNNRADRNDNTFSANTVTVGKGLSIARYEFCFWDLEPGQALVIEADVPDASYWAVQLYTMGTFELVDPYGAISSRNHTQHRVSEDGRVRIVVSDVDPEIPNWLDTTGRRKGLCTFRWFWPHSDASPAIASQVMAAADVARAFPSEPHVSAPQRAIELADRQAHLRWRFRA